MKKSLLCLFSLVAFATARAHEHIEIGVDPGNTARLAFVGGNSHFATYFPLGEILSFDPGHANFPGGYFASIVTFSAEGLAIALPSPALLRTEIIKVEGPAGGVFSFWEVSAGAPTFPLQSGWEATGGNQPSFAVSEDGTGEGHIHGRVFTTSLPGEYRVTFRAIDVRSGGYQPSLPFVVTFTALRPPQLAISKAGSSVRLTFTGRANFVYDLQSSTTLRPDDWETIDGALDGTGALLQSFDPIAGRPRAFYRLVEYQ